MHGYMNSILRIDLARRKWASEPVPDDLVRRFMGGRGFNAKLLWDRLPRDADALGPNNPLILSAGPLTGTAAPGSKLSVAGRSPATGGYADSHVGGHIGPAMRYAGHDVVILEGWSDTPVYVLVTDEGVEFHDAAEMWGKGTFDTERAIVDGHAGEVHVLAIGPAGEKLSRIACLSHDFGRQAGRCGFGAVMGSKKVKALAFRGGRSIRMADPAAFRETARRLVAHIVAHPVARQWTKFGTALHVDHSNEVGCLPTRNYAAGWFERVAAIDGQRMVNDIVVRNKGCFGCTMLCGKYSVVGSGPYAGTKIDGPEYEIIALLGSNCGMDNLGVVARANYLADDLGLDAISLGNVCAFAMESFQKGVLTPAAADGLDLRFGDEKAFLALIEKIGRREGIGDLLADGVREAAARLGGGAEDWAMHTKGLEQSGYETRGAIGQVVGYAINDRGADHNRFWNPLWFEPEHADKLDDLPEMIRITQCRRSAPDIMGMCRFITYYIPMARYAEMISAATGMKVDEQAILDCAERVFNLTRLLNYELGLSKESDEPPPRVFKTQVEVGPTKGRSIDRAAFEKVRDGFYRASGWDADGIPTDEGLRRLDLADAIPAAKALRDRPSRRSSVPPSGRRSGGRDRKES
ncbi:MAG: aldehyde ferredoxin oxidoreductase family protein [Myxococcota bacterium]|nr:aldehyde ferredoxin oxidoreductase family protein [Myxococcota bacterium]